MLIAAHGAVNGGANKEGEEGLGRDDSTQEKGAGRTKKDQTGGESAPIAGQPFADEKGKCD